MRLRRRPIEQLRRITWLGLRPIELGGRAYSFIACSEWETMKHITPYHYFVLHSQHEQNLNDNQNVTRRWLQQLKNVFKNQKRSKKKDEIANFFFKKKLRFFFSSKKRFKYGSNHLVTWPQRGVRIALRCVAFRFASHAASLWAASWRCCIWYHVTPFIASFHIDLNFHSAKIVWYFTIWPHVLCIMFTCLIYLQVLHFVWL